MPETTLHPFLAALVAALETMAAWNRSGDTITNFLKKEFPPGLVESTTNELIQIDQLRLVRAVALALRNALYGYKDTRNAYELGGEEIIAQTRRFANSIEDRPALTCMIDANLASALHIFAPNLTVAHRLLAMAVLRHGLSTMAIHVHTTAPQAAARG